MKYLISLNEHVQNQKNFDFLFKQLEKEISIIDDNIGVYKYNANDIKTSPFDDDLLPTITKVFNNFKHICQRNNINFSYKTQEHFSFNPKHPSKAQSFIMGLAKQMKLERVKPTRFLYHVTETKNVESIMKNGLNTTKSNSDNWGLQFHYNNLIFATMDKKPNFDLHSGNPETLIQIDTTNLPNKWWVDYNMHSKGDILNKNSIQWIFTDTDIPASALTIVDSWD